MLKQLYALEFLGSIFGRSGIRLKCQDATAWADQTGHDHCKIPNIGADIDGNIARSQQVHKGQGLRISRAILSRTDCTPTPHIRPGTGNYPVLMTNPFGAGFNPAA